MRLIIHHHDRLAAAGPQEKEAILDALIAIEGCAATAAKWCREDMKGRR